MTADAWMTLALLVALLVALAWDRFPPVGVLLAGLVTLVLVDVIDTDAAFAGFAAQAPLTVAALYVVAGGARRTGLLAPLTGSVLRGDGGRRSLAVLTAPVAALSAVFNNTPLVAMLVPDVSAWARRRGLPASRFLMPLSFATILGGTVTLIGTSTNLVVSGVVEQAGGEPFSLFELTPVGLPVALVGLGLLVLAAPVLLPDRVAPGATVGTARSFRAELAVEPGGPLDGAPDPAAVVPGLVLVDVIRDGLRLGPDSGGLRGGDRLVVSGAARDVLDAGARAGLAPAGQGDVLTRVKVPGYHEAVVGRGSPLVGLTTDELRRRADGRAVVLGIHRSGARLPAAHDELTIRPGDTLILVSGRDLRRSRWAEEEFVLVASIDDAVPVLGRKAPVVALAVVVFAAAAVSGTLSTLEAALAAAAIVVAGRALTFTEAQRSVDLDVVVMIAAALGIGRAVDETGLAAEIADVCTGLLGGLGAFGVVAGLLLATTLLTEVITNNAAAAIVVPIGLATAGQIDLDPRVVAVGIAVMASSSFLTPVGYQTNAMVYGPGGYRFGDFVRLGAVLNLAVLLTTTSMVLLTG